jgi:ABC-type antimicrobial peptide transport system permease subunit
LRNWPAIAITLASGIVLVWTVVAARRDILVWRLGLRRLRITKIETVSAVGAVGLSVSLVFGALIIGDSVGASLRNLERTRLGPVDAAITLRGPAARDGAKEIRSALAEVPGVSTTTLRAVQVSAVVPAERVTGDTGIDRSGESVAAEPRTIAYDFRYEELPGFSQGVGYGLPDSGPSAGRIFLSSDLAKRLGVGQGDAIGLVIGARRDRFEIDRVLVPEGLSGYGPDFEKPVLSVFLPEGYLDEIPAVTEVLINVSTPAGISSAEAKSKAESAISTLTPVFSGLTQRGTRPLVRFVKADLLDAASRIGKAQASQMIQLGSFSLLSALGLLATVLYLVLSERRRLFGVMLALGMRRRDIAAANHLSALAVAVPGMAGGLLLGVAVGWASVLIAGRAISHQLGSFTTVLSVPPYMIAVTTGSGILIVGILSRLSSSVVLSSHPSELISGRERPLRVPNVAALGVGLLLCALGATGAAVDLRANNPTFSFLGLPMVAAGVAVVSLPTRLRRPIGGLAGAFTVAWIAYVEGRYGAVLQPPEFQALPVVVAAAALAGSVAALAGCIGPAEMLVSTLLDVAGRGWVALRTALRSLKDRRGAVWFVTQTAAAAVAVLAMVLGVFVLERGDSARLERLQLGSWSGAVTLRVAETQDPTAVVKDALADVGIGRSSRTARLEAKQKFLRVVAGGRGSTTIYEVPRDIALGDGEGFIPLVGRNSRFSNDAEAWQALFDENPPENRPWVIMSEGAIDLQLVSPASAVLVDPDTGRSYGLAGLTARNEIIPGIYTAAGAISTASEPSAPSTVLVEIPPRSGDLGQIATELQGRLLNEGATVTFSAEVVSDHLRLRRLVSTMLRVFLSLGLVVAMAAQAAVVTRAVRARVRSLAVMRAIGAQKVTIFRSVAIEGLVMALMGSIAGSVVGSAAAMRLYARTGGSVSISKIASTAAILAIVSAATVGIASILPAREASRVYPAAILRNPEE